MLYIHFAKFQINNPETWVWNTTAYLLTDDCLNKCIKPYIITIENYSALKRKDILANATTWNEEFC